MYLGKNGGKLLYRYSSSVCSVVIAIVCKRYFMILYEYEPVFSELCFVLASFMASNLVSRVFYSNILRL